jgi:hypothetical protein
MVATQSVLRIPGLDPGDRGLAGCILYVLVSVSMTTAGLLELAECSRNRYTTDYEYDSCRTCVDGATRTCSNIRLWGQLPRRHSEICCLGCGFSEMAALYTASRKVNERR